MSFLARLARFLGALLCSSLLAPVARGELDDPISRLRTTVLPNGLTVLTLVDPATPVVSYQTWVRVGSRDETRYTGIAHLFEHMMFKGSRHIAPEQHARLIENRGGRVNAFTTSDVTVYHQDVTPETLPLVVDLEAERFGFLEVDEKMLTSEREVVLEERRLRTEDDPEGRLLEALLALTFTAHPYRWPVIGWRSDVEAVTVEHCREFFRTYYAPNNLLIVVVGSFDEDDLLRRITKAYGSLSPAPSIPRNPTVEPEQRGERRAVVRFDVRSPIVAAAWQAPATGHVDGDALDVLAQLLSGGRSSRLHQRLVRTEAQALQAQGGYWEMHGAGLFYAFVAVRPDASADRAEALLFEEVERLRREAPPADELAKAKKQLEVGLVSGLATTHGLANRVGGETVAFGRVRPLAERLASLQAVTADDVRRVANLWLAPDRRNVVRLLATETADRASTPAATKSPARARRS